MNAIRDLVNFWEHCHDCGALMVTVTGGSVCAHCGFEIEQPDEHAVHAVLNLPPATKVGLDFWPLSEVA